MVTPTPSSATPCRKTRSRRVALLVSNRNRSLFALLAVAVAAAALIVVVPLLWDGTNSYVDQNEDLLRTLPVFPGASQVAIDSHPYRATESGPVTGYGTLTTFKAPGAATEDVLSFFEVNLPAGWTIWRDEIPCRNIETGAACPSMFFLRATSGSAYLSIDPSNLGTRLGSYDVYVDHDSHLAEPTPATAPPAPTPTPTFTPVIR